VDKNIITTPLNGISQKIGNTSIKEVIFEIFCISIPKNIERTSIKELKKILKINPPEIGKSTLNNEGSMRLIKNSVDQYFILFSNNFKNIPKMISTLEKSFYITEQSDAWACIEISGPQTYSCLERICTLDLYHSSFEINSATRTLMEHLNVFIIKITEEKFLLLSASSSAPSFWEAIKTSAENIT
tara:strand:- start:152 stop:709 length:558 start_codon:yes stop_codon:yes gene_type:complete